MDQQPARVIEGLAGQKRGSHSLEQQLALLAEVTQGFASSLDVGQTLQNAIARFVEYLDAEAVSIFLLEEGGTELVCHACAGPVDITGLRMDAGQGIVGRTVREGCCQMVRDVSQDHSFEASVDAGTGFVTRSLLCAPLTIHGRCIGALELINKRGGDGLFDDSDRHLLQALASSAALAIHNARMAQALVEQERIARELELARQIQESLLPERATTGPVAGVNVPAREVSGDFYDHLRLPDGRYYFNLADVSGKGMNAALLMAKATSLLRCLSREAPGPAELLRRVNDEICDTATHGMFVTIVAGIYDPEEGSVRLANAGHPPALLHLGEGRFEEISASAPPLGVLPGMEYEEVVRPLEGALYLFSDGVTEARLPTGRELGLEGLCELILEHHHLAPVSRLQALVDALLHPERPAHDDMTLLVVEGGEE